MRLACIVLAVVLLAGCTRSAPAEPPSETAPVAALGKECVILPEPTDPWMEGTDTRPLGYAELDVCSFSTEIRARAHFLDNATNITMQLFLPSDIEMVGGVSNISIDPAKAVRSPEGPVSEFRIPLAPRAEGRYSIDYDLRFDRGSSSFTISGGISIKVLWNLTMVEDRDALAMPVEISVASDPR